MPEAIAIVGMACRFPGAAGTPAAFWELLRAGRDAVDEIPAERWDVDRTFDPDPVAPGRMCTRRGGFVDGIDRFDAGFFSISPREAAAMDPQQRLLLMVAYEALEDAGLPLGAVAATRGGVFVGMSSDDYRMLTTTRDFVEVYAGTGLALSIAANRVSYSFDLRGPSLTVDTACSSALVAVHLACQAIRAGEASFALAGGVNALLIPGTFVGLSKGGFLAPDGACKSFAAAANGYARAEGAGVVVLKPLAQALADRDRVYAVIRGSAVNQDGRTNGLTAPSGRAQEAVLRAAYEAAGVPPAKVRYVEAHGSGTPLGDPIEARALGRVLGAGRAADEPCLIGSVKTNIGHLESAAGIASLIKAALVLHHGAVPPTLHQSEPNPHIAFSKLKLRVPAELEPLPAEDEPLVVGVSSFGFGGTNAHLVLEEAPAAGRERPPAADGEGPHALCLSARAPEALRDGAGRLLALLRDPSSPALEAVCATAFARRSRFPHRLAAVGRDRAEVGAALAAAATGQPSPPALIGGRARPPAARKPVLVMTGQGSQWAGMGLSLLAREPVFRDRLRAVDAELARLGGWSVIEALGDAERLQETEYVQPAIFALQVALAALVEARGLRPGAVVGHSVGEIAAGHVAGALPLAEATRLVWLRGRAVQRARGQGHMVVVALPEADARAELVPGTWIAAVNSPTSTVVSGAPEAIAGLRARWDGRGVWTRFLPMPFAFHSGQMEPLLAGLRAELATIEPTAGRGMTFVSTVHGAALEPRALDVDYWVRQVRAPVRFADAIAALAAKGHATFVELGPQATLVGDIARTLQAGGHEDATVVSLQDRHVAGDLAAARALARLWVSGIEVRPAAAALPAGGPSVVTLPPYPFQLVRHWTEVAPDARPRADAGAHPLLGVPLDLAQAYGRRRFEGEIGAESIAYLRDHVVQGEVVLPGAAYLEMVLAAEDVAHGMGRRRLADVELRLPMILPRDGTSRRVQLTLSACGVDEATFTIASLGAHETTWTVHCTGRVLRGARLAERPAVTPTPIPALRAACPEETAPAAFYDALGAAGLAYGPAFRTIRRLQRGAGRAFAEVQLPAGAGYNVHPAALDGALQALAAALPSVPGPAAATYLPARIATADWLRPAIGERLLAAVAIDAAGAGEIEGRVELYDVDGNLVAHLAGLRLQAIAATRAAGPSVALHDIAWHEARRPETAARARTWLLWDDGSDLPPRLARALRDRGAGPEVCRDAGDVAARVRALPAGSEAGVVVLGGAQDLAVDAGERRGEAVLELARALPAAGVTVALVTGGAVAAAAGDVPRPAHALLWGLGAVLRSERPDWQVTRIDLGAGAGADELAAALLALPAGEDQLALRGAATLVPRLVPRAAAHEAGEHPPLAAPTGAGGAYRLRLGRPPGLARLELAAFERRAPGPGQVEIEVAAAALNFRDVMKALGVYPGLTREPWLGDECSGVVSAVGEGVRGLAVGQRVLAIAEHAFATHALAAADLVVPVPERLAMERAAALPVAFLTAWYALVEVGRLQPGERVLVHAAAGGVGLAAIEIARLLGAEVLATSGSDRKRRHLRDRGIAFVEDPHAADFGARVLAATGGRGVDVVLNSLGGDAIQGSLGCLAPFGRFVEIGKTDVFNNSPIGLYFLRNNASFTAIDLEQVLAARPALARAMLLRLVGLVSEERLEVPPCTLFPLERAPEAFATMQRRRNIGKLVLTRAQRASGTRPRVRADATYLVTGGLGGLGRRTAASLVRQGARHLVLLGRRAPTATAEAEIAGWRAQGVEVLVAEADVARAEDVARVFELLARSRLPALRGIVHAAGVVEDAALENTRAGGWRRVLAPKVHGALHLHEATAGTALDFFVLYSSVAPLLGSPGQASYAAANAFLDALAAARRARGQPALSIGWGPWRDVGMTAAGDAAARARVARLGALAPETGDALIDALLTDRAAAHVAVLPFDLAALGRAAPGTRRLSLWRDLVRGGGDAGPSLRTRLLELGAAEQLALVSAELVSLLARSLAVDAAQITPQASPATLGVDSMVAVELKSHLEARFGVEVSALLFRSATVGDMARALLARVRGSGKGEGKAAAATHAGRWLAPLRTAPDTRAVLVLFPHVGAGPSAYAPLAATLAPGSDVYALQLPGREERQQEPPVRRAAEVVAALLPELDALAGRPLVLFGHSLGAILAAEVAHALQARGAAPAHLVVSSMWGPRHLVTLARPRHTLPDAQLAAELTAMREGLAPPAHEELVQRILPVARADFEVLESYRPHHGTLLGCAVTAIAARRDHLVRPVDVATWSAETAGTFQLVEVDGGHLYLQQDRGALAALLDDVVRGLRA